MIKSVIYEKLMKIFGIYSSSHVFFQFDLQVMPSPKKYKYYELLTSDEKLRNPSDFVHHMGKMTYIQWNPGGGGPPTRPPKNIKNCDFLELWYFNTDTTTPKQGTY